ncbi:MAG: hypothetical protein KAU31_17605, partial [Spirochaetaceae bacterium]|nr:hypothetical protein [Spirochaetaceae bacterium]
KVLWIPMSGVALVKLGPRILFRLPTSELSHVVYYGGDGSFKYSFSPESDSWMEDYSFSRLLSDAQAYVIMGEKEFVSSLEQETEPFGADESNIGLRLEGTRQVLREKGYDLSDCILDLLKARLKEIGFDPEESDTYFRGGSVSWMMLGDIAAGPYHEPEAYKLRMELIEISKKWLSYHNHLQDIGTTGVTVPFPGARGIKFVLMGNDKERAVRDLLEWAGLRPEQLLYAGNELFEGGNDNMLRKISGITLLSVGDREDPGPLVVMGRRKNGSTILSGVESNRFWMDWTMEQLLAGVPWAEVLNTMAKVNE